MSEYEYAIFVRPHRAGPDPAHQLQVFGRNNHYVSDEGEATGASTFSRFEAVLEIWAIASRFKDRPGYDLIQDIATLNYRFTVVAHEGDVYEGAGASRATWFIARRKVEPSAWEPVQWPG